MWGRARYDRALGSKFECSSSHYALNITMRTREYVPKDEIGLSVDADQD